MEQPEELTAAAMAAGLRDLDMLKLIKADLSPTEALQDLMRRFPSAFWSTPANQTMQPEQPKSFKEMSPIEQDEFRRKHKIPGQVRMVREPDVYERMSPADKVAFHRKNHLPESIGKTRPVGLKTRFR